MRVTMKRLEELIDRLNENKGYPVEVYSQDPACKDDDRYREFKPGWFVAKHSYILNAAYGMYGLHAMCGDGSTGQKQIFGLHDRPKHLYEKIELLFD